MTRKYMTKQERRDEKILYKLRNTQDDVLGDHFRKARKNKKSPEVESKEKVDALNHAVPGGNGFESNRRKH